MGVVVRNLYYKLVTTYQQGVPQTVEVRKGGIQDVPDPRSLDDRITITPSVSFTGDGVERATQVHMKEEG